MIYILTLYSKSFLTRLDKILYMDLTINLKNLIKLISSTNMIYLRLYIINKKRYH